MSTRATAPEQTAKAERLLGPLVIVLLLPSRERCNAKAGDPCYLPRELTEQPRRLWVYPGSPYELSVDP